MAHCCYKPLQMEGFQTFGIGGTKFPTLANAAGAPSFSELIDDRFGVWGLGFACRQGSPL